MEEKAAPKTAVESAKDRMRKQAPAKAADDQQRPTSVAAVSGTPAASDAAPTERPEPPFNPPSESETAAARKILQAEDQAIALGEWCDAVNQADSILDVQALEKRAGELPEPVRAQFVEACLARVKAIRAKRGK